MDNNLQPERLRALAALLALPDNDALELLAEMVPTVPWIESALPELEALPLEHWQAEYTRLFLSGYPKTPCPPFESAYREGIMAGSARQELDNLYRRAGLASQEVPADHLSVMLECAAFLQQQSGGAAAELYTELWQDHLDRWGLRFARDLKNYSHLGLYRSLGEQLERLFSGGGKIVQ